MTPGVKNWSFKKGGNWTILFTFLGRNLTDADVRIRIKRKGSDTATFDSADTSTFVAESGVFSVTLDGADSVVLWDISYEKTGSVAVGDFTYEYDVEITENGSRNPEIEGGISVTRNK